MTFPGQNILNGLILLVILGLCGWLTFNAAGGNASTAFIVMFLLALFFGIAMVMPIGGADMPVVISLLNSFTGLAVAADGFAINKPRWSSRERSSVPPARCSRCSCARR